jgi:rhodanese-related sulfurtransferase
MRVGDWWPFGRVPEISAKELQDELDKGAVQIVDVRTTPEFRLSHIPGARHLPITAFSSSRLESLDLDPSRPVAAICLTAHRSVPAVRKLRELGYEARQLRGGMRAWWRMGGDCVKG